jgi:hypothetical protein
MSCVKKEVKVKFCPCHAIKAEKGSTVTILLILDLGARWGWMVNVGNWEPNDIASRIFSNTAVRTSNLSYLSLSTRLPPVIPDTAHLFLKFPDIRPLIILSSIRRTIT